jgi:uncharacterized protein YdhG (YjbR/CyaY superfamily)
VSRPDADTPIDDPSLRLPRPAVRGLIGAGVTTLGAAWAAEDDELLAHHGVGPKAVRIIRSLQPSVFDDYLAGLPAAQRGALERVRAVVREAEPDAEEGTSYGMPAFRFAGRPLLGFKASRNHLSLHPFSAEVVDAVRDRLGGFDLAKGTIRFTPETPVPDDVIAELLRLRKREISG